MDESLTSQEHRDEYRKVREPHRAGPLLQQLLLWPEEVREQTADDKLCTRITVGEKGQEEEWLVASRSLLSRMALWA